MIFFPFRRRCGGIVWEWLADPMHERPVIVGSLALAFPALQLALLLPGKGGIFFLLLAGGFCLLSSERSLEFHNNVIIISHGG